MIFYVDIAKKEHSSRITLYILQVRKFAGTCECFQTKFQSIYIIKIIILATWKHQYQKITILNSNHYVAQPSPIWNCWHSNKFFLIDAYLNESHRVIICVCLITLRVYDFFCCVEYKYGKNKMYESFKENIES